MFLVLLGVLLLASGQQLQGSISAVYDLLERVIPGSSGHFALSFTNTCGSSCYIMKDSGNQLSVSGTFSKYCSVLKISGTSVSELTAALGEYFREFCNMTIGWP